MNNYPGPDQPYPQQPTTNPYPPNPGYLPQGQPYPQQGYPQMPPQQPIQPPKKKSKLWLILGIVIGAIVLCSAIGSIASHNSNTGTADKPAASNSGNTASSQPAAPTQHFKPGDTVNVGSIWQIVVSNVRTDGGGQYDSLKSGDTYLAADMTFKNVSSSEQQLFGTADWTLKDPSGQTYDSSYDSNITATAPQGKVEPGDPGKGTIIWEVPASTKQFTLAFENNMFESGQVIWDISVS